MSAQAHIVPSMAPLRLGFLGLGWIGRARLDAIAHDADVHIAALSDADPQRLRCAHDTYAHAEVCANLPELLRTPLDGVIIATPNGCHAEQAITCLEHGLSVFCQKPLAINAADAERVVTAARRADRLLAVDLSYRHVQGMEELRQRISSGELGEIRAIDLVFHNAYGPSRQWCFDPQLAGGGCLLDLGVHLLDLALWLQSGPALELVSSRLYSYGQLQRSTGALEDLAFVEYRQHSGAVVRLACSWHAQLGADARIGFHIHGTRAGAVWSNIDGSFVNFALDWVRGAQRERLGTSLDDWGPGALRAWIARVRRGERFDPAVQDVLTGARLIDQAYRA